jgi:hypothetical protein
MSSTFLEMFSSEYDSMLGLYMLDCAFTMSSKRMKNTDKLFTFVSLCYVPSMNGVLLHHRILLVFRKAIYHVQLCE